MTLPETSAGSSIFEGFVGIVTVQDLAAIGAAAVAGASIGDVLADPAFVGDADLSARVASLRDSLGFTDGGGASELLALLLPVSDQDQLMASYTPPDDGQVSSTATVDLAPPIVAATPPDGSFANGGVSFQAVAVDVGAGVDVGNVGTPLSAALLVIDGVIYGDTAGELVLSPGSPGPAGQVSLSPVVEPSFVDRQVLWYADVRDRVGNRASQGSGTVANPFTITFDGQRPTMSSAVTGRRYDTRLGAETGQANDSIKLSFATGILPVTGGGSTSGAPLDPSSVSAADFSVDGAAPQSVTIHGSDVYLGGLPLANKGTPTVAIVGSLTDLAGNVVPEVETAIVASDGIPPILTLRFDRERSNGSANLTVDASEPLLSTPVVTVNNGSLVGALVSTGPTSWTGVVNGLAEGLVIARASATDMGGNGLKIIGKDMTSQVDGARTSFATGRARLQPGTALLILTHDGTPAAGPPAGPLALSNDGLEQGAITLASGVAPPQLGDRLAATYEYEEAATFLKDTSAPLASFDPAPVGSPPKASAIEGLIWLTLLYNEPVSLTAVGVDGVDQTSALFTTDRMRFVLPLSQLRVGEHELTVRAVDDAGNLGAEQRYVIVITGAASFDILLRPGWNLVSLPEAPADDGLVEVLSGLRHARVLMAFDQDIGFRWSIYEPNAGSWSGEVTRLFSGQSYWIYASDLDTLAYRVVPNRSSVAQIQRLRKGFNYIGVTRDGASAYETKSVPASRYLVSLGTAWVQIIRCDPDPAVGFEVLTPGSVGWNGVDPAGPDGKLGYGPDRVEGTADDVISEKADNVVSAAPNLELARGYIIFLDRDASLLPQYE